MKPFSFFLVLLGFIFSGSVFSQQKITKHPYTFLLTGASFASSNNGWFEIGCELIGAKPINKAIGGEAIADAANRIIDQSLYNLAELENIDALIIMHVHDKDVFDESQIKANFKDYTTPFTRSNYAAAFDYVIKRYVSDCYNLKFEKFSKYYGSEYGKPSIIVLCTDWHDGRVTYNTSVRKLSKKWGLPLVEFDTKIGFSKNALHPVTGKQMSLLFAKDTQTIDGVEYGWHPEQGKDAYIQQRMGAIFADTMKKFFR